MLKNIDIKHFLYFITYIIYQYYASFGTYLKFRHIKFFYTYKSRNKLKGCRKNAYINFRYQEHFI